MTVCTLSLTLKAAQAIFAAVPFSITTTIQKFGANKIFFLKESNTWIPQGCINLFKSYSTDIYNVTKDIYFK